MVTFNKFLTIGFYIMIALDNGFSSQNLESGERCDLLDGSPGICKSALKCKWLEEQIVTRKISPSTDDLFTLRCGFENNDEITCCADDMPNLQTVRKSKLACDMYRTVRQPFVSFLVLNGNYSALGEFPHMAALGYLMDGSTTHIDFRCDGSLISERYILTAAHCAPAKSAQPTLARLGTINIINPEANLVNFGEVLDVNIEKVILHPDYISIRNYHDIALARLSEVVKFNKNLHPACLNMDLTEVSPSAELFITGWGRTDVNNYKRSEFLLKARLLVVDLNECNNLLSPYIGRKLPKGLNYGHFCAHDPNGLSDACDGDSGGPIQIIDNNREMPIIVGVTSSGVGCGSKLPSLYTRVSFYLDWIESLVWPD